MQRRLIVMRHGKSAWSVDAPDVDRPLSPRGRSNATTAAEQLAGLRPDLILASPARRSVETVKALTAAGLRAPAKKVSALYGDDIEEMVAAIRRAAGETACVLVVGHYPSVVDLAAAAAAPDRGDAWTRLQEKFPTSAYAVLEWDGAWATLGDGTASLTRFDVPR